METEHVLVEVDCETGAVTGRPATAEELAAFRVLTPPPPPDGRTAAVPMLRRMAGADPLAALVLALLGYPVGTGDNGSPD